MNKEEILEKIIDEMSDVSYTLSDKAHSEGLTKFFRIYQAVTPELKEFTLTQSAKLLGYRNSQSMKEYYNIGEAMGKIQDARLITLNVLDNFFGFYEIFFDGKHSYEWIRKNLETATRKNFPNWTKVEEADNLFLIENKILDPEFKCFAWGDGEGVYCDITFAVQDDSIPF